MRGLRMKIKHFVIFIFAVLICIGIYSTQKEIANIHYSQVTLTEFEKDMALYNQKDNKVTETSDGTVTLKTPSVIYITYVNPKTSPIVQFAEKANISYEFKDSSGIFNNGYSFIFFIILAIFLFSFFGKRQQQQIQSGQGKKDSKLVYNKPDVKLDDVGGLNEETKTELNQVITLFKDHRKAKELGIQKPKAALLYGPPGTGKTMIAKAIAHELNAVFFAKAGSSFMEMYVGVGSSRIREMFQLARNVATENRPALVFIDEIDAIAKKRGGKNSHEERENTLNELLKELDGVDSNENVFFIAATNLYDQLDEAFKRSGRISNELYIGLPEERGRIEILEIHAKNYKLNQDVIDNIPSIAKTIRGYSGADIAEMYSKAAKQAFNQQKEEVDIQDIQFAIDRMILGTQNHKLTDKEVQKRVAYHEAGHALIQAITLPNSIRKATIIPRGGALGFVAPIPKEIDLSTYPELMDRLAMIVAGGVAEREIFGHHSIGVGGDIQQARQLIDAMMEWGIMEDEFQLVYETKEVEKLKQQIFRKAIDKSVLYIKKHIKILHKIAEALIEKETLDGQEIQTIVEGN